MKPPKIQILKDGPYIVSGNVPLYTETAEAELVYPSKWTKGEVLPQKETCSLCRCGKSATKPYCDNAHTNDGFDGSETAEDHPYLSKAEKVEGPGINITDYKQLCSGARFCDAKGGIWELVKTSDNPRDRQTVIEQTCNCPSGRLAAWNKETGDAIEPDFKQEISLTQDSVANVSGPLWVKGRIPVISASGVEYDRRNRVTLCRCGESENKPFCDGSHIKVNFSDGAI